MTKRYKIRKEQLERVVESFVMESAAPEAKKYVKGSVSDEKVGSSTSEKDWGVDDVPSQSTEAKKHKQSMGSEQPDDSGEGMKKPPVMKTMKMKHAPEAKKHVKGSVSESKKKQIQKIKKFMLENNISETELEEGFFGASKGELADNKKSLEAEIDAYILKYSLSPSQKDVIMNKAEQSNYVGKVTARPANKESRLSGMFLHWAPGASSTISAIGGALAPGMQKAV